MTTKVTIQAFAKDSAGGTVTPPTPRFVDPRVCGTRPRTGQPDRPGDVD